MKLIQHDRTVVWGQPLREGLCVGKAWWILWMISRSSASEPLDSVMR